MLEKVWENVIDPGAGLDSRSEDYNFQIRSVKQTLDFGFILTGYTSTFRRPFGTPGPAYDVQIFLAKINSNGELLWQRLFGGDKLYKYARSVQQTSDGGYIVVGAIRDDLIPHQDSYLLKTDANGNLMWEKILGGWHDSDSNWIQETLDGGYIITGEIRPSPGDKSWVYLAKTDVNGNVAWEKKFGGNDNSRRGTSVQQTPDGGYIVAGQSTDPGALFLVKTDAIGNSLWAREFNGSFWHPFIQQTPDRGYIVGYDAIGLAKIDNNANLSWKKSFVIEKGFWGFNDFGSLRLKSDEGYIITGLSGDHSMYLYLAETDANGNIIIENTSPDLSETTLHAFRFNKVEPASDGGYIVIAGKKTERYDEVVIKKFK
jgi:hypothetical protein